MFSPGDSNYISGNKNIRYRNLEKKNGENCLLDVPNLYKLNGPFTELFGKAYYKLNKTAFLGFFFYRREKPFVAFNFSFRNSFLFLLSLQRGLW